MTAETTQHNQTRLPPLRTWSPNIPSSLSPSGDEVTNGNLAQNTRRTNKWSTATWSFFGRGGGTISDSISFRQCLKNSAHGAQVKMATRRHMLTARPPVLLFRSVRWEMLPHCMFCSSLGNPRWEMLAPIGDCCPQKVTASPAFTRACLNLSTLTSEHWQNSHCQHHFDAIAVLCVQMNNRIFLSAPVQQANVHCRKNTSQSIHSPPIQCVTRRESSRD